MSLAVAIKDADEPDRERDPSDSARERRCIVSGEVLPDSRLVRFVVSPDGEVTPDIAATLPGRGIWVGATRAAIATAVKKGLFVKAAKANVTVSRDMPARVETQLLARMQADLGMARRAGLIEMGFESVLRMLQSDTPPALVIEASDGSADGKRKIFGASHARGLKIQMIECLTAAELSLALGRENVIHAALKSGRLQERLSMDAERLSGFRSAPLMGSPRERDV